MIPVLLDHRPDYCPDDCASSLLSMPVGQSTLLDHAMKFVLGRSAQEVVVVPTFPVTSSYEELLRRAATRDVRIVEASRVPDWTKTLESQDMVCLMDPIRYPLESIDLEQAWLPYSLFHGAAHFVAVGAACDAVTEELDRDANGKIRRIRRSYAQVAPAEIANSATFASIVRASSVQNMTLDSAASLRAALSRNGVVVADVPFTIDVVDLSKESGLLKLNHRALAVAGQTGRMRRRNRRGLNRRTSNSASVHSSATLVGAVVVQSGAVVEKDVTIVGPSVIATDARVASGSIVVQSLIASSTQVPSRSRVLHRVVVGEWVETHRQGDLQLDPEPVSFGATALGQPHGRPLRTGSDRSANPALRGRAFVKRTLDLLLSGIGSVVLGPMLLIVAILIKLDSPGPALFCHEREGVRGKKFPCFKLRTMIADAHLKQRELSAGNEADGPQFMLAHDPRVTRLGSFLRKTNMDELPQLFNVILGHMSLIGPRPSPFRENQICVPWRRARLSVRPGLSGLWQVCRDRRDGDDFHQWIYYDLLYVQHQSLWLDAKILAATLLTLGGRWGIPLQWLIPRSLLGATPSNDDSLGVEDRRPQYRTPTTPAA